MSFTPAICTIITLNRLAWARTLMESCLEHHPDARCSVLIIDLPEAAGVTGQPFDILRLEDLSLIDPPEWRFKYTPFELCCALKPFLLEHVLKEQKAEHAFYFDSDIMVLSRLDDLERCFEQAAVLLTPHLEQDLPDDGNNPNDAFMLLSGIFNGGFIGVGHSAEGLDFLQWWKKKLWDHCIEDHFNGHFVDQRFLDLAIGLFDVIRVVRDPGYNVAYWNLHSRNVKRDDERWLSNERPLVFFHFSDYRPEHPARLSGHQNRFQLSDMPDIAALFENYRSRLVANGLEESSRWPYGYARYHNGREISAAARRTYLRNVEYRGMSDPFDSGQHGMAFRLSAVREWIAIQTGRAAMRFLRRSG